MANFKLKGASGKGRGEERRGKSRRRQDDKGKERKILTLPQKIKWRVIRKRHNTASGLHVQTETHAPIHTLHTDRHKEIYSFI